MKKTIPMQNFKWSNIRAPSFAALKNIIPAKKSDKQKQIYEKKSSITQITLPNYYYG